VARPFFFFYKAEHNVANAFAFLNSRMLKIHAVCIDRVQKAKQGEENPHMDFCCMAGFEFCELSKMCQLLKKNSSVLDSIFCKE
jgi:hypothetical protein